MLFIGKKSRCSKCNSNNNEIRHRLRITRMNNHKVRRRKKNVLNVTAFNAFYYDLTWLWREHFPMIPENQLLANYHSYDLVYTFWIKSGRLCQVCREPTFKTIFEHPPVKTLKTLPVWVKHQSKWYLLSFTVLLQKQTKRASGANTKFQSGYLWWV